MVDKFDRKKGEFTISLATPLYFLQREWKVAILDCGFSKDFVGQKKTDSSDLIHITTGLIETSLVCNREEWLLILLPHPGKTLLFQSFSIPQFKRVAAPQCSKLTFSFVASDGAAVSLPADTHFYMTLLFDTI